jgi:hypothetical protein
MRNGKGLPTAARRQRAARNETASIQELEALKAQKDVLINACLSAHEYLSILAQSCVEIAECIPHRAFGHAFIDGLEIAGGKCEAALLAVGVPPRSLGPIGSLPGRKSKRPRTKGTTTLTLRQRFPRPMN